MRVAPATDVSIVNINQAQPEVIETTSKIGSYALRTFILLTFIGNLVITYAVMLNKNEKMTQKYFIYVTPSNGFFKIWPVIYTLLFLSILHNTWKNIWKKKSSLIIILSNCLLMVSSGIWEVRSVASIVVGGLVLATVDNSTIWFWRVLMDEHEAEESSTENEQEAITQNSIQNPSNPITQVNKKKSNKYTELEILIVRNIYSLYIGWVTVTGTVILGLAMVYWWGFSLCLQFILFWITTPLAAIALYVFMAFKQPGQYKYCFGYVVAVIWGFIGAALASSKHITQQGYC